MTSVNVARKNIPGITPKHSWSGPSSKPPTYVLEVRAKSAPDGEPIAFLLIEREEEQRVDSSNGRVYDAKVRLTYTQLIAIEDSWHFAQKGWFDACYSTIGNEPLMSLTSANLYDSGYVIVEMERLQGQRFGTYLMNEIVSWAKRWPEANIVPVKLLEGQAYEKNKARRNRFYEQFGIEFDYADDDKAEGKSKPTTAGQLRNINSWEDNIRELDLHGYMSYLLTEHQRQGRDVIELQGQLESLRHSMDRIRAAPFRWAFERRFPNFMATILNLVLLGLVACGVVAAIRGR